MGLIEVLVLMVQAHQDPVLIGAEPEARPWSEHSSAWLFQVGLIWLVELIRLINVTRHLAG
jgi:hypothetical protein